jgi:diadenosine tetraphosphate (Ap4A) HIT family hydrolase
VIVEPEGYVCIADESPVNSGHALVLQTVHRQYLQSADCDRLHSFLREAIAAVRERCEPDGMNVDHSSATVTPPNE